MINFVPQVVSDDSHERFPGQTLVYLDKLTTFGSSDTRIYRLFENVTQYCNGRKNVIPDTCQFFGGTQSKRGSSHHHDMHFLRMIALWQHQPMRKADGLPHSLGWSSLYWCYEDKLSGCILSFLTHWLQVSIKIMLCTNKLITVQDLDLVVIIIGLGLKQMLAL